MMDSRDYRPFYEHFRSNMDTPVTVENDLRIDMDLKELELISKKLASEFFWYFYLDLKQEAIDQFLDHVKKGIRIPSELNSS